MKEKIDRDKLISAIKKHNNLADDHYAENMATRVETEGDVRLLPNLNEWIEGKEISDLWFGEYCINAIMSIRNNDDFLDAFLAMSHYLKDEETGNIEIWGKSKK